MPFLPLTIDDMRARGWEEADAVVVTGDAYVDHPSFGAAIISRVLEAEGLRAVSYTHLSVRPLRGERGDGRSPPAD